MLLMIKQIKFQIFKKINLINILMEINYVITLFNGDRLTSNFIIF
jgi:hypothetical protein